MRRYSGQAGRWRSAQAGLACLGSGQTQVTPPGLRSGGGGRFFLFKACGREAQVEANLKHLSRAEPASSPHHYLQELFLSKEYTHMVKRRNSAEKLVKRSEAGPLSSPAASGGRDLVLL